MKKMFLVALGISALVGAPQLQAKQYSSCDGAYNFYLRDKSAHKAFATTNGALPDHGKAMCGGGSGSNLGAVISVALNRCNQESKNANISGACRIIKQQ